MKFVFSGEDSPPPTMRLRKGSKAPLDSSHTPKTLKVQYGSIMKNISATVSNLT